MGNSLAQPVRADAQEHREPLLTVEKDAQDAKVTKKGVQLEATIFQLNSFIVVLWPVCITVILASIVACGVQDRATKENMKSYLYYKNIESSGGSNTQKTMEAFINAIVVIAFIAIATFVVVLMYKFNCMKILVGYLMLSSAALLGLVGSAIASDIFCDLWQLPIDSYSFTIIMYNFAIVGTTSIFYQKGIPKFIEQGYLIATSVIMAWELCQWPEWSVWTILCMLAFWDLFAVLAPCGPLRCLVNMISREGRPMPGLLYEAQVHETHVSVQESKDMDFLTRNNPEESVVEMTKWTDKNEDDKLSTENAVDSRNLMKSSQFHWQLHSFYSDFNPQNLHNVRDLSQTYANSQMELWATLYEKYQVHHVPKDRPYPSPSSVRYQQEEMQKERDTIKLGLGDFIFYSVLVGRASLYGFASFVACFVCIMVGLGITMYLLAKFNALPALPIPILLASGCYWMTHLFIQPYLETFQSEFVVA